MMRDFEDDEEGLKECACCGEVYVIIHISIYIYIYHMT